MVSQITDERKRLSNLRNAKTRAIAEHVHVEPMGDSLTARHWLAQSSHNAAAWYTVTVDAEWGEAKSCTCPAGQKGLACKHQAAAESAWTAAYLQGVKARLSD